MFLHLISWWIESRIILKSGLKQLGKVSLRFMIWFESKQGFPEIIIPRLGPFAGRLSWISWVMLWMLLYCGAQPAAGVCNTTGTESWSVQLVAVSVTVSTTQ